MLSEKITDRIYQAIIYADGARENFSDVRIITTRADIQERAADIASKITHDPLELDQLTKELIGELSTKEFVKCQQDGEIIVCVNCDEIDDVAIDRAIELLASIQQFQPNTTYYFGDEVSGQLLFH